MLSHKILTNKDIARTSDYYEDGIDDYFAKENGACEWQGNGASELNLQGSVESERFRMLLAGKISDSARISRASTRQDSKQRLGIDLTFSAPKSVSMQALIHGDVAIIRAHEKAVQRTIAVAEERALARKKVGGKSYIEHTGNLTVAKFRHETNREAEPHLHTHAIVLNITKRSDGEWRALKNDEIIKSTLYLGSVYNAELADELQKLGLPLRFGRDGNFELAHISREQLEPFSTRSAQVEGLLAEKGLSRESATAAEKQLANMQSRKKKEFSVDREALHRGWKRKAKELDIDFNRREAPEATRNEREPIPTPAFVPADEAAKRAVRYAVNHLTERQSVMDERVLVDTALKHAVGAARLNDIQTEITNQTRSGYLIVETPRYSPATEKNGSNTPNNGPALTRAEWITNVMETGADKRTARQRVDMAIERGGLVRSESRYTTQTALEREKRTLQIERDGRGQLAPIMDETIAREKLYTTNLNTGQRDAASLMLTTENRVIGVQGFAGTGKSHMLDTAKNMIEGQGYHVRAFAPYGSQVKALRELNVEANTLASFLKAKDKNIDDRTVLVIDEAGVVPSRIMEQTLKLAEKAGARVVLMGDTAQTKAIEAGRPFDQLQAAGMKTAKMDDIQRQKNATPEFKSAVELAAQGDARSSLQRISEIHEIKNNSERRQAIARDYVQLSEQDRDNTIIVSGTNEARREINKEVRDGLGTSGNGIEFNTLVRRDTTQAERRFSKNYHIGDVIQPEKDYRTGLNRHELYDVIDTGPGNRLTVKAQRDGEVITFSPATHRKLSVYEPERAELSPGDMVRVTRNDKDLDLANGDRFKVAAVEPGKVTLASKTQTVELQTDKPLHLDHAYATTVHSAQGLTEDRVLIDADANSRTTAKDVYYVAISRARYEAKIYTNSVSQLPAAISRDNIKHAALDLARQKQQKAAEQQAQRSHTANRETGNRQNRQRQAERGREVG